MANLETLIRQILETLPTMFSLTYNGTIWSASATYAGGPVSATGDTAAEAAYNLTATLALNVAPIGQDDLA